MRILVLITHYSPVVYGAELFAQKMAEAFAQKEHQVDVVTGRWQDTWPAEEIIQGVHIYRVPVFPVRYIQTLAFILPQYLKAKQLLQKQRYHLIHAHIFPSLITGALLPQKVKKLVTIQGGDLADYPETYGFFAPFFSKLIAWALRHYQIVHTTSSDLALKVEHMVGRKNIQILPNGVDAALLNQKPVPKKTMPGLPRTKFLAVAPSRLTEKNNLAETIKAVGLLRQEGVDIGLIIAGTGHLQQRLQELIKQQGLSQSVLIKGYVNHSKLMTLIKAADVAVRVSIQEGFGIAILEALALGTPVVTSLNGGIKDFASPKNSWIAPDTSAPAIAEAVKQALNRKDDRKLKAAQALVATRYTWSKVSQQFEAISFPKKSC